MYKIRGATMSYMMLHMRISSKYLSVIMELSSCVLEYNEYEKQIAHNDINYFK